jgi:hypothetical protein
MKAPEGFSARLEDDNLGLVLQDGLAEEKIWLSALELAGGLMQLEEGHLMAAEDSPWDLDGLEDSPEAVSLSRYGLPEIDHFFEGGFTAAEVELFEPYGLMLMRRIAEEGGAILELTIPNGSVYSFDFQEVREYLRPILPR